MVTTPADILVGIKSLTWLNYRVSAGAMTNFVSLLFIAMFPTHFSLYTYLFMFFFVIIAS